MLWSTKLISYKSTIISAVQAVIMSTTQACLGCNGAADAHDRRLLAGPTHLERYFVHGRRSLQQKLEQTIVSKLLLHWWKHVLVRDTCAESALHCLTAIKKQKLYSLPISNQFYLPSQFMISPLLLVLRDRLQLLMTTWQAQQKWQGWHKSMLGDSWALLMHHLLQWW